MPTKRIETFDRLAIISVAGLVAQLRAGKTATIADVLAVTLASGVFGLAIAVVWCVWYNGGEHFWFMMAVSLPAGAGCMNLLDFADGHIGPKPDNESQLASDSSEP